MCCRCDFIKTLVLAGISEHLLLKLPANARVSFCTIKSAFRRLLLLAVAIPVQTSVINTFQPTREPKMESKSSSRKVVFAVIILLAITIVAIALSSWFAVVMEPGTLIMFDDDYSDSVLGWAIAIPVLIVTAIVVVFVLAGTGVMVVGALAVAAVATILAVLFALLLAFLPMAIVLAVPILAVVGFVKLVSKPA
jgi:hypothetical protein